MGSHSINLALRFLLELAMLTGVGYWAWKTQTGTVKYILVIIGPLLLAAIWGVFAVPNDPSRSGQTVIAVSGWIRLVLEILIFAIGSWAIYKSYSEKFGLLFLLIVILHYAVSYDRITWLLKQ